MKRIFTTIIIACVIAMSGSARQISETEAKNIAQEFMSQKVMQSRAPERVNQSLTTAYTSQSIENENILYVFNRGENDGFIIVSGDDAVSQRVLGYCDNGQFDYNQMPTNMKWLLSQYEEEIAMARRNGISATEELRESLFNKNVGPLVEARWSQDEPYNNLCPMYSETLRCATGCVATAAAQIMYHHKHPIQGVGSKDYVDGGSLKTIDFSQTTYEWDLMTPVYSSLSTEAECNAVATLMYHVGRSIDMMYSNTSGAVSADVAPALARYFDYDKSIVHRDRNYYTIDEWEQFIINDIDNGCPILYRGQSNDGGHAFVLDGYNSDGYVHINWGWNGMSNGYFLLHALTPEKQGIGGFSGGYNSGQSAIFNIKPNKNGNETYELTAEEVSIASGTYALGEEVSTTISSLTNAYWNSINCNIGYMLYDANGEVVSTVDCEECYLSSRTPLGTISVTYTIPTDVADGEYKLYLAHTTSDNKWKRVALNTNSTPYYIVNISNGEATISSNDEGEIWATSVVCNDDVIYSGCFVTFNITVSNTMNHEYFGSLYVSIYESKGKFEQRKSNAIALSIPAGKEVEISIPIKIEVGKGDYCVFITDGKKNKFSDSYPISVAATPAIPDLAVSNFQLTKDAKDWLKAEYTITNNGEDYTGQLRPWVLFTNLGSTSSYINSEKVTIKSGESMDFVQEWTFEDGVVGEDYICTLWYYNARIGGFSQLENNNINFTLSEETAINSVENALIRLYPNPAQEYFTIEATTPIEHITIYSLQGCAVRQMECNATTATMYVGSLSQGSYIVVAKTIDGNIIRKITIQ